MHIDGNLIPLFAIAVGLIITVTKILTESISRYKLKAEQIRADAMVRAEEVRSRNELELERLMRQDQANSTPGSAADSINSNIGKSSGNTDAVFNSDENSRSRSRVRE